MSDNFPSNLRYSKDHEWARREDDGTVSVGITSHAVDQLGDITMVTLSETGTSLDSGDGFGDIDSVKAVSELFAPVDGEIAAVNEDLQDSPESVNTDPYGTGWMVRLKLNNDADFDTLLDAEAYTKFVSELDE